MTYRRRRGIQFRFRRFQLAPGLLLLTTESFLLPDEDHVVIVGAAAATATWFAVAPVGQRADRYFLVIAQELGQGKVFVLGRTRIILLGGGDDHRGRLAERTG